MTRKEIYDELYALAKPSLEKDPKNRTYKDRYFIWELERYANFKNDINDEGEEIEIYDGEKLANNEIKDGFDKDFPEWFRNLGKYFGKQVYLPRLQESATLMGVSYTYLDYYYIVKTKDGKKHITCIEDVKFD